MKVLAIQSQGDVIVLKVGQVKFAPIDVHMEHTDWDVKKNVIATKFLPVIILLVDVIVFLEQMVTNVNGSTGMLILQL